MADHPEKPAPLSADEVRAAQIELRDRLRRGIFLFSVIAAVMLAIVLILAQLAS